MNGAACAVAIEAGHLGHFVHHALSGDGGVSVNQNRQHTGFIAVPRIDAGTGNSLHHGVHRLEVRGVRRQGDGDLFSGVRHLLARVAEVILHISVEQAVTIVGFAFELTEDVGVRLAKDVGQRAEAAAVRHADDDFTHATGGSRFNQGVEGRNQAFSSFEGEALLADELFLEELLEERGLADLFEHVLSAFSVQTWTVGQLDVLANPLEPLRLGDVHVFNPNRVTVRRLQMGNDVSELCGANAHFIARLEHRVEVRL